MMTATLSAVYCLARASESGNSVVMTATTSWPFAGEWEFCRDDGNHLGRLLPCQGWHEWEFCRDDGQGPR